ncbi:MAG: protein kinase domain-containing protein, partial [Gemmatimonadaceae bacterium]
MTTPPIPTGDVQWPRELDGEYEWIGELGRGGMAIVYHARDRELRREVAVKVVRTRYAHDHEAVARLAREARTVARLEHPNIVALHAVKRLTDDSLALVMQLVPGRTLKQALQADGAFNADRVERVLRDISRALAYAHGHGVVHRDVKPENIFLDAESGRALLSDFGVAISREADTSLTATGTAIGTPTYMSPEQIDGTRVDGRSDLYSLGLVAWEMLTGKRPWDGEGLYNVIYKQKHEELPGVEEFRSNVSERLRYLVDGLLRKQPDARWPSAERLLLRLNDASDPPGLRQWRQYKRRQLKQRRELEQTLPNEGDPTDAATAHFRRSETQRAALDARVDAGTPQIIDVEQSPLAPDAWRVQDDEESPRRPLKRWLAAAAALLVAGSALAVVLTRGNGEDVANAADTRTTFSDMGTIQVPVQAAPASTRSDSTPQVVRDTLGGRAPREPLPKTAAATPEPPPRAPPAVARQRIVQPTTPPVVAAAPAQRDSSPAPPPNEPPATPSLSFPAERALVAVGARHSCAIEAGRARCWGNNENGQLGDGSLERQPIPAAVAGDFSFAQLAAGESFTCGVTTAGEGLCWGSNESGELGDGTSNMRNAPVRVSGGHTFRLIRTGLAHACGLTRSGRIVCWGSNRFGQLGDGARGGR